MIDALLLAGDPPAGLLGTLTIRPKLGFRQGHRRGGGTVSAGAYRRLRDDGRLTWVSSANQRRRTFPHAACTHASGPS